MASVLREIERHPLYIQYLKDKEQTEVPETLLRDLLFATMETSEEKLREKMRTLIEYCNALGKKDIEEFLKFCSNKHKKIFHPE